MGTGLGTENKIMGYLTNKKIDSVNDKGVYIDEDGLRLRVDNKSNKNWVFRYHIFGQSKDMGLGKYPVVSLKDARRKMVEAKKLVYDGKDPLKIKRSTQLEKKKKKITFQQISDEFVNNFQVEWSNKKHAQQWTNTLNKYACPTVGKMPVEDITSLHILNY